MFGAFSESPDEVRSPVISVCLSLHLLLEFASICMTSYSCLTPYCIVSCKGTKTVFTHYILTLSIVQIQTYLLKERGEVGREEGGKLSIVSHGMSPGKVVYLYWNPHSCMFCSMKFLEIKHARQKPPTHWLSQCSPSRGLGQYLLEDFFLFFAF